MSAAALEGDVDGQRAVRALDPERVDRAWAVLATVLDPEVPALSVCDLGIVRGVRELREEREEPDAGGGACLEIVLTPTYSGCPATEVIERDVLAAIAAAGLGPARVRLQRAPAWTTDWISEEGRRKLRAYGIAPPGPAAAGGAAPLRFLPRRPATVSPGSLSGAAAGTALGMPPGTSSSSLFAAPAGPIACPRCDSPATERLSAFGSTACKALYRCRACREPFEHFKPI